ncbi:30S ribosomal protein S1 [Bacillaceae bacterium W0354]
MSENQEKQTNHNVEVGDEIKAKVIKLEEKQVIADIGYKFDGIIPISELSHLHVEHTNEVVSEGDEIDVIVKKIEDEAIILSKRDLDRKNVWQSLESKLESQDIIDATVIDVVNGGLIVDVGLRAFMPASQVETYFVEDFSGYKGKSLRVRVMEMDKEKNRVIVSHRAVSEEEEKARKSDLFDQLKPGNIVEGTVERITNFGAFVNLGNGVDGLVHISQLSHERVDQVTDVVNTGDTIKVKVLSVDRDTERISLSLKDTLPGPWSGISDEFKQGTIVEGTVKRLVNFGAFVEIKPGVEGLVHISQISGEHIGNPQEVLTEGQKVKVKVLDINEKEKRISLSIKEAEEDKVNEEYKKYQTESDDSTFQLGDLIGDQLKDFNN